MGLSAIISHDNKTHADVREARVQNGSDPSLEVKSGWDIKASRGYGLTTPLPSPDSPSRQNVRPDTW